MPPFENNTPKSTSDHANSSHETVAPPSDSRTPSISLPKGGGAIQGIGEKFDVNPATGTGSLSVPLALSPGRSGFAPQLSLSYDSGRGNSAFGLGWNIGVPFVFHTKSVSRYYDDKENDVFKRKSRNMQFSVM